LVGSRDAGYSSLDTLPVILFYLLNLARRISRVHEPLNPGLTTLIGVSRRLHSINLMPVAPNSGQTGALETGVGPTQIYKCEELTNCCFCAQSPCSGGE
jgi:hypothetical protein